MSIRQGALDVVATWPTSTAAAGWKTSSGAEATAGPAGHVFELASVTKLLVSYGALVAIEEKTIELDLQLGPSGSTVRHILAHASGLGFESSEPPRGPSQRRIYSNVGFELLGHLIATRSGMDIRTYITEAVMQPLEMSSTDFYGSAAYGTRSTVNDLLKFVGELLHPTLISLETLELAVAPHFGELEGVLPGFGIQTPNLWGLGFEISSNKFPHWSGAKNSAETFGHFGRSGSLLWVDPIAKVGCVSLSDRDFGAWAKQAWPQLCDRVFAETQQN